MRLVQERRAVRPPVTPPAGEAVGNRRRLFAVPAIAGAVITADQLSKSWALHHTLGGRHVVWTLWFDLTFNSGAAFGVGRGVTPVVEAAVIVVLVVFFFMGRRAARDATWPLAVALGLVLGGAAGNLADRAFRHIPGQPGAVIDFIAVARVGTRDWWPLFNVADSCIVVGVVVLILSLRRRSPWATASGGPDGTGTDG
jgi:signal peptidase II